MSLDFTPPPSCYLPDDWWLQRPVLRHIRQAAYSRGRGADALLAVTACRVMALVDYRWLIPPISGGPASLNMLCGLIAPPGIGKSNTNGIAAELVPFPVEQNIAYVPNGSGEGIAATYVGMEGNKADCELVHRSALFYCDEGAELAEISKRTGSTFASQLRSAAHGAMIGQQNGNKNTTRIVPAHQYRLAFVVGFQPPNAGPFIAKDTEGTPQRFIWATPFDRIGRTDYNERPEWPGQLQIKQSTPSGDCFVSFSDQIRFEVLLNDDVRQRGESDESTGLNGHRDLEQLRLAAVLATLDGHTTYVTDEDWEMARQWSSVSAALRDYTLQWWNDHLANDERTKASTRGVLADVTDASKRAAKVERVARRIHQHENIKGTTAKQPWSVTSSWLGRDSIGDTNIRHEAIAYGVEQGWFKARSISVYVND